MSDFKATKQSSWGFIAAWLISNGSMVWDGNFHLPLFILISVITLGSILVFAIVETGANCLFDKVFDETKADVLRLNRKVEK